MVKQIKQGELSMLAYFSKLKAIWMEIVFYWPLENPHSQERKNELKVRMFTFLMDFNSEYENLVSQLIHREKLTNLDEAIGEIVKAESRKGVSVESSHGGVSSSSATFISKTPAPSLNSNSTLRIQHQEPSMKNSTPADSYSQDKETLVSYYCKKKGHTKDKCHKLAYKLLQQMQTQHPKKADNMQFHAFYAFII